MPDGLVLGLAVASIGPGEYSLPLNRAAAATRTVVLAVHRLSTAHSADWVAVLGDGTLIEQGTPIDLARAGGAYATLLEAE